MDPDLLFPVAGLCALGAAWAIFARARGRLASERAAMLVGGLTGAAILAAGLGLVAISPLRPQGINLSLAATTGAAALLVLAIYAVGLWRHGVRGLGLFLLPVAGLALLGAPWLPEAHEPNWLRTDSLVETGHLLLSLAGFAVLTLAAAHAAMQLLLDRALKRKRIDALAGAMPALAEIERHLSAQVSWAAALIGASLLTGLAWQWEAMGHLVWLSHKVLFSLFGFGVLVLLLIKRRRARWSATTTSKVVLAAYALLGFAYFGVRAIHNLLH